MHLTEIIIIATALAADSFAVSVASGTMLRPLRLRYALRIGLFFSIVQALMPWIGWYSGLAAGKFLHSCEHWIAAIMLFAIGGKMIYESFAEDEEKPPVNPLATLLLITLAIATSIDALAVGITFSFLHVAIMPAIFIIGTITFICAFAGTCIGATFGHFFEDRAELASGIVLLLIGLKILLKNSFA
jgi:putative Mn2+ efflux pump MntP